MKIGAFDSWIVFLLSSHDLGADGVYFPHLRCVSDEQQYAKTPMECCMENENARPRYKTDKAIPKHTRTRQLLLPHLR